MSDAHLRHELDGIVEQLNQRVIDRRAAGAYPDDLEQRLDRSFRELVQGSSVEAPMTAAAHRALHDLVSAPAMSRAEIETSSKTRSGAMVHRGIGAVVGRQTSGTLGQVQRWRDDVERCLHETIGALDRYGAHDHAELRQALVTALDHIAVIDRLEAAVNDLARRVERLEAAAGPSADV